jgi:hypothetical protein
MPTYAELRLRIDRGVAQGSYRIVATGPAGEALGRFKLPFADIELENFILKIGSTRRGRRRIDSPEMELAKTFGTKLFGALFEGDVRELYRSSIAESRADGRGLRVTLSLTGAPELLQVPWEYMYDHPSFLSISTWTPIVRYLDLPKPRRPLQIDLPLRILGLVSAPSDFEAIDAAQERAKLESALAPLTDAGAIAIDWLEEASLRALQRQLRKADYHVFHYIGHGGYDNDADDGVLLFEDEHGRGQRVSGVQLGRMLADEVSLRLAVLNSCEGGRSSLQDPFSGVATSLIEFEIPAVIGMQFEITDRAAIVFGGEFYSALADGLAVDAAVAEARKAIYADQNDVEWGTPVLFMRVADGKLFDVKAHAPVRPVGQAEVTSQDRSAPDDAAVAAAAAVAEKERADAAEAERDAEAEAEAQRLERERLRREADAADAAAEAERRRVADAEMAAEAERADEAERTRLADAEAERAERERVEREAEAARLAAAETERLEAERIEAERIDAERVEQEQLQREAVELDKSEPAALAAVAMNGQTAETAGATGRGPATTTNAAGSSAQAASRSTSSAGDAASGVALPRIPEYQLRAAGRAALGGVLTMSISWAWNYINVGGYDFGSYLGEFIGASAFLAIAMVVAVVLAERFVPAARVPDGEMYRFVGGNNLAAAAIQGALTGATVGFAVQRLFYEDKVDGDLPSVLLWGIIGAGTFLVGEAVISALWRRHATRPPGPGSQSPT